MSVDHGDPKAVGRCAAMAPACACTHTQTHAGARRHLGNDRGISELRGRVGGSGRGVQWAANMLHEKFLLVMAAAVGGGSVCRKWGGWRLSTIPAGKNVEQQSFAFLHVHSSFRHRRIAASKRNTWTASLRVKS